MSTLVLTVSGDDRAGLVNALADVVETHGGNWGRSHLAELAGKFAGIVVVEVPDDRADALVTALTPVTGLLDVTVHPGSHTVKDRRDEQILLELVGNDRPGIIKEISRVLNAKGVSIDSLETHTTDATMAGGLLFEARARMRALSGQADDLQDALEGLAGELMVDITVTEATAGG